MYTDALRDRLIRFHYALNAGFAGEFLTALLPLFDDWDLLHDAWEAAESDRISATSFAFLVTRFADRECRVCHDCNNPVWEDEASYTANCNYVCESCVSNYYRCAGCEELHGDDDFVEWVHGDTYCERCLNRYCYWCEECEEYDTNCHEHEPEQCGCEAPHLQFKFPANGQGHVREDERFTVELPAGTISRQGIKEINWLLDRADLYVWTTIDALDPVWQNRKGNFTRRLSTALYQNHGMKLEPATLSEIGNLARQHTLKSSSWKIEFTRNLNGSRDEFCNDDSCWWTTHEFSRCALKAWGGLAIRTFTDEWGGYCDGRAWVQPLDENMQPTHNAAGAFAYVVYNGYGNLEGYTAARLIAHLIGRTYRKIGLELSPQFINGETGYLVADEATCEATTDIEFSASEHNQLDSDNYQEVSA